MSSKVRPRSPKAARKEREDHEAQKTLTPAQRQRQLVINLGVGVLLLAFLMTSGIMFVNLNPPHQAQPEQQAGNDPDQQVSSEIERWQKDVNEHPQDTNALANLAYYLMERANLSTDEAKRTKDMEDAAARLNQALAIDAEYSFALQQMGRLLIMQKKYDEAQTQFEAAIKAGEKPIDPNDKEKDAKERNQKAQVALARVGLAYIFYEKKDMKGAEDQLNKVIEADPGNSRAYLQRAQLYNEMGQKELARKDLDTVVQISERTRDVQSRIMAAQLLYMMDEANAMPASPGAPEAPSTPGAATPATPAAPEAAPETPAAATPAAPATPAAATPAAPATPAAATPAAPATPAAATPAAPATPATTP